MGYPELDQDESIILETRNVKFKSISLDAILTNKRIILIDSKKNAIPPQDIPISSIRIVEMGENAIRDPFLLLILSSATGEKRQMVITFSRQAGAERRRECNEWVKQLDSLKAAMGPDVAPPDVPVQAEEPEKPETSSPTRTVVASSRPVKKKIEIARPLSKIIEKTPASPVPIETSSLPSGSFCSRCGNRVPLKSTFCNHCGTPIVHVPEKAGAPQPAVPQVQVPLPPPISPASEKQGRPIEQIIHSIEPLIEDSVPRTQPSPRIEKSVPEPKAEPVAPSPPVPEPSKEPVSDVVWPVLSSAGSPMAPATEPVAPAPESPPPSPAPVPGGSDPGKPNYRTIGIIAAGVIVLIIGIVLLTSFNPGPGSGTGVNVTTPAITTPATTIPTTNPVTTRTPVVTQGTPAPTQVTIPPTGVWVRVTYPNTFTGSVGTPGDLRAITDSGDRFYQVSTTNGTVAVSLQKTDGSADRLAVEIYKNGVKVKQDSTATPKGVVDIQFDLKTIPTSGANSTSAAN
ncbi:MAG: zinc-ribbon domain-containing protein [Methanoregula sp.]|nr:zinc-ribbon domain-containing protein [Methanoregula sp.]